MKITATRHPLRHRKLLFVLCLGLAGMAYAKNEQLPVSDIQRFTTVVEHIKNYYVQSTDDGELLDDAIRGMLAGLDPHSTYLDTEEFSELKVNTSGQFGGLGIEVSMADGFVKVISPIDDTPAHKAGIQAGDLIIRIDDHSVKGMTLREAVEKMRGKPGSEIVLTIIREGEAQPLNLTLKRAIISVMSVKKRLLEPDYGYIRISQFQTDTGDEIKKSLRVLIKDNKKPLKGLVLDLRNNPGGVLEASVQVSDAFLDRKHLDYDGLIVYTKGRLAGSQIKEAAHNGDILKGAPIVVLVNGGSASASEIVAGALQDHQRAIIIGTKTFGKGSVQTILPLKDHRGLKLTTALYYTPKGRSIQATGIEPDIIVENLKWPENDPNRQALESLMLRESDLQGHIENEKDSSAKKEAQQQSDGNKDFQLHESLNVLKGLTIYKNQRSKTTG